MSTSPVSGRVEITPELLADLEAKARAVPFKVWATAEDEDDGVLCVVAPEVDGTEPWWILVGSQNVPGDNDGVLAVTFAASASPSVVLALVERIRSLELEVESAMRQLEEATTDPDQ